jgi:hypothetical protein
MSAGSGSTAHRAAATFAGHAIQLFSPEAALSVKLEERPGECNVACIYGMHEIQACRGFRGRTEFLQDRIVQNKSGRAV